MSDIKQWVQDLFIIILAITFLELLIPESSMRKYIKFLFSIIIMAVILHPVSEFIHI